MAFDGIVVADLVHEFRNQLIGGRIAKIAQPETDELLLTIKTTDDSGGSSSARTPPFRLST